jgi:hypothetical protein
VRFTGFLGEYELSVAGRGAAVTLDAPGEHALYVALEPSDR